MASKYSYEPIQGQDQVRLLVLKPGVDDVDFTFQVESLATNPMYEAISLDLDDLTDTRTVYCHEKALDIPHTLFIALEFLRYQDKERVLWADSVCTNQDDPLERNHQGKLRGAIFAKASQILIWLGGDASDLDGVQELVPHALSKLPKLDLERPNIDLVTLTKTWEDFIEREEVSGRARVEFPPAGQTEADFAGASFHSPFKRKANPTSWTTSGNLWPIWSTDRGFTADGGSRRYGSQTKRYLKSSCVAMSR